MRLIAIVFFFFGNAAVLLGLWLLLDSNSLGLAFPNLRVPFGVLLVVYGGFRIYSAINKWKKWGSPRVAIGGSNSDRSTGKIAASNNPNAPQK